MRADGCSSESDFLLVDFSSDNDGNSGGDGVVDGDVDAECVASVGLCRCR